MARKHKARRKSNPRRHAVAKVHHRRRRTSHRRRNPVVTVHNRRRRRNRTVVVNRRRHHRRNPMGFGNKQLLEMSAGMLVGVAAAKYTATLLPTSLTSLIPPTSFTGPLITGVSTFIASWAAFKFLPGDVAKGVVLGGSALTLSQLLNVIAPPNIASQFALSGVGDIVQTQGFSVPDRVMRAPVVQMAPQGVGVYGRGNYRRAGF